MLKRLSISVLTLIALTAEPHAFAKKKAKVVCPQLGGIWEKCQISTKTTDLEPEIPGTIKIVQSKDSDDGLDVYLINDIRHVAGGPNRRSILNTKEGTVYRDVAAECEDNSLSVRHLLTYVKSNAKDEIFRSFSANSNTLTLFQRTVSGGKTTIYKISCTKQNKR